MVMLLTSETFVLRGPQEDGGLDIAVTRYCPGASAPATSATGDRVSLLFLHGVSYRAYVFPATLNIAETSLRRQGDMDSYNRAPF